MLTDELDYELPEHLIAQYPTRERDGGRLLVVGETGLEHRTVRDWPFLVPAGALVVLNDTKVMRARLYGVRATTGGKVELLFLQSVVHRGEPAWQALAKAKRRLEVNEQVVVEGCWLTVLDVSASGLVTLRGGEEVLALMDRHGHVPLPPYVHRPDEETDGHRYQTVFARQLGSAAAPTAGLHLTSAMLQTLRERSIDIGFSTLHVGAGTFRPVNTEVVEEYPMHIERFFVSSTLSEQVRRARAEGRPIVAVGTTVVRALESAVHEGGTIVPGAAETNLLITPGYSFRVVDALLTNFHAPRSTLLALVYAFAGASRVRAAYESARASGYRFLSYGDAMWLPRRWS